jgi:glycerol-3-phosphate O-acyltransferase
LQRAVIFEIKTCKGADPLIADDTVESAVCLARDHMEQRKLITKSNQGWAKTPDQVAVLQYYSNSIAHYFDA